MAQSYHCIAMAQKGQSSNCQVCLMTNQTMFVPTELFSHPIYYANELWACFPLSEHKYKVWIFSSLRSAQFAWMWQIKDLLHQGVAAVLHQYPRLWFRRMQSESCKRGTGSRSPILFPIKQWPNFTWATVKLFNWLSMVLKRKNTNGL